MRSKPSPSNPTPQQQLAVHEREGYRCARCGGLWRLAAHHRKLRSAGGGNDLHNLVVLCGPCHDLVHSRRLEVGEPEGWIISPYWPGARSVAIKHHREGWVLLSDSGEYVPAAPLGVLPVEEPSSAHLSVPQPTGDQNGR